MLLAPAIDCKKITVGEAAVNDFNHLDLPRNRRASD
jgi:hypothetical protein